MNQQPNEKISPERRARLFPKLLVAGAALSVALVVSDDFLRFSVPLPNEGREFLLVAPPLTLTACSKWRHLGFGYRCLLIVMVLTLLAWITIACVVINRMGNRPFGD
jgi:hypothetical protein